MTLTDTSTNTDLDLVWQPLTIKNVTLRNRIVRSSHGTGYARGRVTERLKAYHLARARGGVALSFGEGGQVHWSSPGFTDLTTDNVIEGLADMTAAVQAEGMRFFQQLMHGGPTLYAHDGTAPWAASAVPDPILNAVPRPLTKNMIDEIVAGFAAAARRVKAAGMDGVEVHAGHSYLFSSFLSPATNKRTDDYGGPLENRMRLLVDVLEAIRIAVGPDFVVGARLSPDGDNRHTTFDDIVEVSYLLEEAGLVDYLNFSMGSHYRRSKLIGTTMYRAGYQIEEATGALARGASVPTMVTGRIMDLTQAEQILREGKADMVSMVRALIADPELVKKTREGRDSEIRCCISCSQACAGGMTSRGVMGCVVNPAAGYETTRGDHLLTLSPRPRRVLIIGGGPSGLEAARTSALRGHRVVLHEKSGRLGGQVKLIEKSPSRSYVAAMLGFYEAELHRLGVEVVLRSELRTKADVEAVGADAVVVATGAEPRRDGLQAWRPDLQLPLDSVRFLTGWDVLEGAEVVGPVLLVDEIGHYESIDVAETLVQAGHKVHHATRFSTLGANIPVAYDYAAGPHQERLYQGDYELYTRVTVTGLVPGRATIALLAAPDRTTELDVQTVVFMTGSLPDYALQSELDGLNGLVLIGDAAGPRTLEPAIAEGSMAPEQFEEAWARPEWVRYAGGSSV